MLHQESKITEDIRPEQTVVTFDPAFPEYAVVGVSPRIVNGLTVYDEIMWVRPGGNVDRGVMTTPRSHGKGTTACMIGVALPENEEPHEPHH